MDRETAARPLQRDNVISMKHWAKQHPIKICPTRYDEVGHIAQELMRYGAVEVRLERLSRRPGADLEAFRTRWIPLEEAYFAASQLETHCEVILHNE